MLPDLLIPLWGEEGGEDVEHVVYNCSRFVDQQRDVIEKLQ